MNTNKSFKSKTQTIAIIMAMETEAKPILDTLNFEYSPSLINSKLPVKCYQSSLHDKKLYLIYNGMCKRHQADRVGTQAAAVTALLVLEQLQPDLIISVGTSGAAHKQGFNIGDVVIGMEHYLYHDRRVPIPNFESFGYGHYPVFNQAPIIAKQLKLKQSVIASGNSIVNTTEDIKVLNNNNAYVKEMEVASIAEIAQYYNTPVLAIKAVTDYFDQPNESPKQFLENFKLAVNNLTKIIQPVVEIIN